MTYFAKIVDGKVVQVIVASKDFCDKNMEGDWIETKNDDSIRKQFAGIGMSYDEINDIFIAVQPYPSWILDENFDWQAPIPIPDDSNFYGWNESNQEWVTFD